MASLAASKAEQRMGRRPTAVFRHGESAGRPLEIPGNRQSREMAVASFGTNRTRLTDLPFYLFFEDAFAIDEGGTDMIEESIGPYECFSR